MTDNPPSPSHVRVSRIPGWAGMAGLSVAIGATGISWVAYLGLYQWIAELQLKFFGSFMIKLTVLFTLVGYVLLCGGLLRLLMYIGVIAPLQTPRVIQDSGDPMRRPISARGGAALFGPLGIFALAFGLYLFAYIGDGKTPTPITAEALEKGASPASHYVSVSGKLLASGRIDYGDQSSKTAYIPIVSDRWAPPAPIRAFAAVRPDEAARWTSSITSDTTVRGMARIGGLPGPVRVAMQRAGADIRHAVVVTKDRPEDWRIFAWLSAIGGGALCAVAAICLLVHLVRGKPDPEEIPASA